MIGLLSLSCSSVEKLSNVFMFYFIYYNLPIIIVNVIISIIVLKL